jgi:Zn-dependent M16 (insulinase) family peptidase
VLSGLASGTPVGPPLPDALDLPAVHHARRAQLPVAFTCEVHDAGGLLDPDGPVMAVIAQLVFAGGMNARIRQGGAYGVDYDTVPERGVLWISSRRDPLPMTSFEIMSDLIGRIADGAWDGPPAEDGKLAVLRVTDPVDSPATAARRAWHAAFTGHTAERWNAFRQGVLAVTDDVLADVAARRLRTPRRATLVGDALHAELSSHFDDTQEL